jgi:EAL domain-containing protein (putative c-di-GMP-specific phosphodiesterase class I)/PAS domain-containing protein
MREAPNPIGERPNERPGLRGLGNRFVSFAFASADLLIEVNTAGTITFAMGAATGLTEVADRELVGRHWSTIVHPDDQAYIGALIGSLGIGSRCGPVMVRLAIAGPEGSPRPGVFSACRLPGDEDRVACTLSRATASVAANAAVRRRDPETQLLEKDSFGDVVADVAAAAAGLAQPVALTLLDIPGLAELQQRLPADTMSELIRGVGAVLRTASIDGNAAGRVADTRFGVLHQDGAANLPAQIVDLTRRMDPTGEGVAVGRTDVDLGFDRLAPEEAMKAIRYVVNSFAEKPRDAPMPATLTSAFEHMVHATVDRMSRFSETVRQDDFAVAYQPIVDLASREIRHFEVLARFKDGESPFEAIRFAEQVGIIERFDLGVCLRAIKQLEAPVCDPRLALAVNISGKSIENALFVKCLTDLIDKHRGLSGRLILEITESSELHDLVQVDRIVQQMRRRGCVVCLDDFGAGAASFHYLNALPADFVKIDGRYVRNATANRRDRAFLKAIAKLCRELGTTTIAEMIETEEQAAAMADLGIGYGQGYLFGRPSPDLPGRAAAVSPPPGALHATLTAREAARVKAATTH